jgi:hypothetical protein
MDDTDILLVTSAYTFSIVMWTWFAGAVVGICLRAHDIKRELNAYWNSQERLMQLQTQMHLQAQAAAKGRG